MPRNNLVGTQNLLNKSCSLSHCLFFDWKPICQSPSAAARCAIGLVGAQMFASIVLKLPGAYPSASAIHAVQMFSTVGGSPSSIRRGFPVRKGDTIAVAQTALFANNEVPSL